ncbi:hypothetical protein EDB89DRAFT_1907124 [Lactarius sanguifluus]|nr:hypothetical protein EDB89DRAFT_1907124 [Lactarius sanguifluus]
MDVNVDSTTDANTAIENPMWLSRRGHTNERAGRGRLAMLRTQRMCGPYSVRKTTPPVPVREHRIQKLEGLTIFPGIKLNDDINIRTVVIVFRKLLIDVARYIQGTPEVLSSQLKPGVWIRNRNKVVCRTLVEPEFPVIYVLQRRNDLLHVANDFTNFFSGGYPDREWRVEDLEIVVNGNTGEPDSIAHRKESG